MTSSSDSAAGYGPAYPGGAGQPHAQQYPHGPTGAVAPTVPPSTVRNAFLAWMATVVISVIGSITGLFMIDDMVATSVDEARKTSPDLDPAILESGARAGAYGAVVGGIVFALLFAFFAVKMKAGRNWARITLTVLGILSILFSLYGLATTGSTMPTVSLVLGVLSLLTMIAALVLMWLAPSNRYFAEHKAAREATAL